MTFFASLRMICPVAATPATGIETPFFNKRTSAVQRYFYALILSLWQCAWENLRVRRFLLSGSLNPAYTVAILLETKGDSQTLINKETVMSEYTPVTPTAPVSPAELYCVADRALALIHLFSLATDHPDREAESQHLYVICTMLAEYVEFIATVRLQSSPDEDVAFDEKFDRN